MVSWSSKGLVGDVSSSISSPPRDSISVAHQGGIDGNRINSTVHANNFCEFSTMLFLQFYCGGLGWFFQVVNVGDIESCLH